MKVKNMVSERSGREVANQFIILDGDYEYFQSYGSIIVKRDLHIDGKIILDEKYWNYSRTTSKYRSLFLGETTKETEAKIKNRVYQLANLN